MRKTLAPGKGITLPFVEGGEGFGEVGVIRRKKVREMIHVRTQKNQF